MSHRRFRPPRRAATTLAVLPLSLALAGGAVTAMPATSVGRSDFPSIEARVKPIIERGGQQFRDLNGNGRVDQYENWHLPDSVRAKDLARRMTLEEKAGLMQITSEGRRGGARPGEIHDPHPNSVGYVTNLHIRQLIVRDNPTAFELADRNNDYQEIAEGTRLGIPISFTSNPRNHVNEDLEFGISEASGEFSTWPGTLGLAATHDPALVQEFAEIAGREWRSSGIHKTYGYQIEIASEPRWRRISGTFGESPELVSEIAAALVTGFQGEGVAQTVKHFPGDGAVQRGLDPHNEEGMWAIYPTPGSLYEYQLPPFQAAVDAGITSIMSYYNAPNNALSAQQLPKDLWYAEDQQFEEVGAAYNEAIVTDLLRGEMGFTGYVNSDSGILGSRGWGVGDLTVPERFAKAVKAGTNLFSDNNDPSGLIEAVNTNLLEEADLDESVRLVLTEMFGLGLFEDPYVDPELAQEIADSVESQALADEAHRKSIVLMRNDTDLLPLTDEKAESLKVYVEVFNGDESAERTQDFKELISAEDSTIQLVDSLEEADTAIAWVRPSTHEVVDENGLSQHVSIELNEDTGVDVARVQEINSAVPTTLVMNMVNPWVMEEIEPGAASVLSTFNVKGEALLDVIRGRADPSGKLPMTIPADQEAVENNASDVPGYAEDFDYAYTNAVGHDYTFGFGLTYND